MVLRQYLPDLDNWDALILATDIDTNALAEAEAGIYSAKQVEEIPAEFRAKFLRATASPNAYRIAAHLRPLVVFEWMNLVDRWPMHGPFDAIFCRNVIIYFDGRMQESVVRRASGLLASHGTLYLGHSESLFGSNCPLKLVGRSTYRKVK
jgi:chemotaxis protein methyltransferase CheR